jgi:hypothetical protein
MSKSNFSLNDLIGQSPTETMPQQASPEDFRLARNFILEHNRANRERLAPEGAFGQALADEMEEELLQCLAQAEEEAYAKGILV